MAVTHVEFEGTATRHVIEDTERKVEAVAENLEGVEGRLDAKVDIAVGEIQQMVDDKGDEIVERVLKKLEEKDRDSFFSAEVRRAAKTLDDSGLGVPTVRATLATSTPKVASATAARFTFPVDTGVKNTVVGSASPVMLDEASVNERISAIHEEYRREIRRHEVRQQWLESVIDSAKDIRRKEDSEVL